MVIMAVVGVVGTFGMNFQMTTALMATQVYDKGAGEYGVLGSVMAIGSLSGALLAARRTRPGMRLLVGAAFALRCDRVAVGDDADLPDLRDRAGAHRPERADR